MISHRVVTLAALLISPLAFAPIAGAQVVNVQPLLGEADEEGFTGEAGLSVDYYVGNVDLLQARVSLLLRYAAGGHRIISSTRAELGYRGATLPDPETRFLERVSTHLRHQVALNPVVTWETYVQVGEDSIKRMNLRLLAGTGARFEVYSSEDVSVAIGVSGMYEYEVEDTVQDEVDPATGEVVEVTRTVPHMAARMSTYLTLRVALTDTLGLNHTTHFQPNFGPFDDDGMRPFIDDFRVASQTSLTVELPLGLGLGFGVDLSYDHDPPRPVVPFDLATRLELLASF